METLDKDEDNLLQYLHYCACNGGLVASARMSIEDLNNNLPRLQELGFILHFGRRKADAIRMSSSHPPNTHIVFLTEAGMDAASESLKARQERAIQNMLNQGVKIKDRKREDKKCQ